MSNEWTHQDDKDALANGWILANVDGTGRLEIQRADEKARFDGDADALFYVRLRAAKGHALEQRALAAIQAQGSTK